MYKLLIADDERRTREGLQAFFARNPCGFELVGVADGGLQALAMAQSTQPDLLLTDIRMPDLDGLSLARRCTELQKPPHLLIMSSYVETQYIKSALKLRAVNYLIKPIDLTELQETMLRIVRQLDEDRAEQARKETIRRGLSHSHSWLRGHFLSEVLDGICTDPGEMEQQLDFLNMELPEIARYGTVSVRVDRKSPCFGADPGENKEKMYSFRKMLEDILGMYAEGYVFEREGEELVLLVMEPCDAAEETSDFGSRLDTICADSFSALRMASADITIGRGKEVLSRHQLPYSYGKARENLQARLILGDNQVISDYAAAADPQRTLSGQVQTVKETLLRGDAVALGSAIDCFFAGLAAAPTLDQVYAAQCAGALAHVADEVLAENGWQGKRDPDGLFRVYGDLARCETLPEMKKIVSEYLTSVNAAFRSRTASASDETVEKIRAVIREHYAENLTIQSIAERVYLSPNYICMVFKQATGQTINQYTTQVRMEQAKKLLEGDMRITDIGAEVGYAEPGYFNKIFKKYAALTPKEYRQMVASMGRSGGTA